MPDNNSKLPSKKSTRGQKKVDPPKNKVPFATEVDLWNFEENHDPITLENSRSILPNSNNGEPTVTLVVENVVDEPPVEEVAAAHSSPILKSVTQAAEIDKYKELAELNEKNIAAIIIKKNTEAELWGDFVDDDESDKVTIAVKEPEPEVEKLQSVVIEKSEPKSVKSEIEPTSVKTETLPPTDEDEFAPKAPSGNAVTLQITKFSRLEKICSLSFLALFLIGSFFAYKAFQDNVKAEANDYAEPNFPIAGKIAKVDQAKTYWRQPVREGPNPDPIKLNVILIPVIEITLEGSDATKGVIRVIFRNGEKVIVGDSLTKTFTNNKFVANQSATLAFPCTDGFTDFGEQEAYRAHLSKPWSIEVYEGADDNAPLTSFKLLFTTPVSIIRH